MELHSVKRALALSGCPETGLAGGNWCTGHACLCVKKNEGLREWRKGGGGGGVREGGVEADLPVVAQMRVSDKRTGERNRKEEKEIGG